MVSLTCRSALKVYFRRGELPSTDCCACMQPTTYLEHFLGGFRVEPGLEVDHVLTAKCLGRPCSYVTAGVGQRDRLNSPSKGRRDGVFLNLILRTWCTQWVTSIASIR